ncbi:hypothetical protein ACH5RR_016598 [Cinchona calisaya]|uniref:DUF4378 domain-containing protein n=1 Tax=Cinchona calisaya TaxID=153742 RepID=A0ABD2ZWG2_9GENT
MEGKLNTPSVIASLMGLDELPPQQTSYTQGKVLSDDYLRKTASIGLIERSSLHGGRLYRKAAEKRCGLEHVFDSNICKTNKESALSNSDVKSDPNRVRAQFSFGRQKNLYAKKHLSIDKKLCCVAEPSDILEDLHVTGENSLGHFNHSNLSTKQLHDSKALQLHLRSGHATTPIITRDTYYRESEPCKQSRKALTDRTVLRSIQKPENDYGESDIVYVKELLKTHSELKDKASNFSLRIVVLKPNSRKAQKSATNLLLFRSDMICQPGDPEYREDGELLKSECRELNIKLTETEDRTSDMEPPKYILRDPRQVSKEAAQEERKNTSNIPGALGSKAKVKVDDSSLNLPEALMTSSQGSFHWEKGQRISNPFPTGSFISREAKKQIFERWKTTKSFEEVEVSGRRCTLGQMFAIHDGKARPRSMYSKLGKNCLTSALCPRKENSKLGSSVLSSKIGSTNEYIRKLPSPKLLKNSSTATEDTRLNPGSGAFQSWSLGQKEVTDNHHKLNSKNFYKEDCLESRDSGVSCEKRHYFPGADLENSRDQFSSCNILRSDSDDNLPLKVNWVVRDDLEDMQADDHSSLDVWDNLTQKKTSYDSLRGELIHRCTSNDSELAMKLREINQPSPDSVLEPPFKQENLSSFEFFDSPISDLSGLAMKLQLLNPGSEETNSEASGMAVSSDADTEKESVKFSWDNGKLWEPLRPEESRDFSYLIDVLDEANLCGYIPDMGSETWQGKESPVSPSVFEALEKKYGKQTSWQKSERKLLFDRISSGLKEILDSCMNFRMLVKPLRRRFNATLRRNDIEEELWMLLISQEREVAKDLSEKVLGKEMKWLELEDDVSIICREIVDFLFDELATEVYSNESI